MSTWAARAKAALSRTGQGGTAKSDEAHVSGLLALSSLSALGLSDMPKEVSSLLALTSTTVLKKCCSCIRVSKAPDCWCRLPLLARYGVEMGAVTPRLHPFTSNGRLRRELFRLAGLEGRGQVKNQGRHPYSRRADGTLVDQPANQKVGGMTYWTEQATNEISKKGWCGSAKSDETHASGLLALSSLPALGVSVISMGVSSLLALTSTTVLGKRDSCNAVIGDPNRWCWPLPPTKTGKEMGTLAACLHTFTYGGGAQGAVQPGDPSLPPANPRGLPPQGGLKL